MNKNKALTGLNVVGFVTAGVGPMIIRSLGGNGATVLRVESSLHPDLTRTSSPFKDKIPSVNTSYSFAQAAPDGFSLTLNMKNPRASEVSRKLIEWADVIVENNRPGVMEKWNMSYEEVSEINPGIIMVRSSQMGETGSFRNIAAMGPQLSGLAGFNYLTGWPDRSPVSIGVYPDFVAPPFGVTTLLAALNYRKKTGIGQYIDLSQYETSILCLMPSILDCSVNQRVQIRNGNKSDYACPHSVYRCKGDDRWCAIAVFTDREWEDFCKTIDHTEWMKNKKFESFIQRKKNEDQLDKMIEDWTSKFTAEEVMEMMQSNGVQAGVVRNIGEVMDDCPQTKHRNYFTCLEHPELGNIPRLAGESYLLSKTPYRIEHPSPSLGEHNEYICCELLEMSTEDFLDLLQNEVLF